MAVMNSKMPFVDYLKLTDYIGSSEMRMLARGKTPAHVLHRRNNPPSSESMILGAAFHGLVEEAITGVKFQVWPLLTDGRTDAGRKERLEASSWQAETKGLVLKGALLKDAQGMMQSLLASQFISSFLGSCIPEVTILWDQEYGSQRLKMRTRIDLWDGKNNVVGEIKTGHKDVSPRSFGRTVASERYDIQMIQHLTGLQACGHDEPVCMFIAVESEPPYLCGAYPLDRMVIHRADVDWQECLGIMAAAEQEGYFGYEDGLVTLTEELVPIFYR